MTKYITAFILFIFICNTALCIDQYRVKDKYGRYQGKYVRIDNTTVKRYNQYNQFTGKIVSKNNKVRVYDKYGRFEYEAD